MATANDSEDKTCPICGDAFHDDEEIEDVPRALQVRALAKGEAEGDQGPALELGGRPDPLCGHPDRAREGVAHEGGLPHAVSAHDPGDGSVGGSVSQPREHVLASDKGPRWRASGLGRGGFVGI